MPKKKRKGLRKYPYQKPAGSLEHRISITRDFSKMIDAGANPDEHSLINAVLSTPQTAQRWIEYTDDQKRLALLDLTAAARMAIIHHSLR